MGLRRRLTNHKAAGGARDGSCADDATPAASDSAASESSGAPAPDTNRRKRTRRLLIEQLGQRRVLAVITGTIFHDADQSLRSEPGEISLASRLAYLDANENGVLDGNEAIALADEDGRFEFRDVTQGLHSVRLFDGSDSQFQTFPIDATEHDWATPVDWTQPSNHPIELGRSDAGVHVLTDTALVTTDLEGFASYTIPLDFAPQKLIAGDIVSMVANAGNVANASAADQLPPAALVTGTELFNDSALNSFWVVPSDGSAPRELIHGAEVSGVAVGPDANGVLLSPGGDGNQIHGVTFFANGSGQQTSVDAYFSATEFSVPLGAQVLAADAVRLGAAAQSSIGSRTVIAWPNDPNSPETSPESGEPGMEIALWSNSGNRWITQTPSRVEGVTELVSFDDDAGLLAVRYEHGGIGVLDVDAGFVQLHDLAELNGPAVLVAGADALASVHTSAKGTLFSLRDLRSGNLLINNPLSLEQIGTPLSLVAGDTLQTMFVLGDLGISQIQLDSPASHFVSIQSESDRLDLEFGVQVTGQNQPPTVSPLYDAGGDEDTHIQVTPEEIANLVSDQNQDRLFSMIVREPMHGTATVGDEGELSYEPEADFNGIDSFAVQFHDGQSPSETLQITVSVDAVPDAPTGVEFVGQAIPEHTVPEFTVGTIQVQDVDVGDSYDISVTDQRFEVRDGNLVFVAGHLDHETEPEITLSLFGYDSAAGAYFDRDIVIRVEDENDPILDVYGPDGQVYENSGGQFVTDILVEHFDNFGPPSITLSVDDERFEVVGEELHLKDSGLVDFESEPEIVVMVTADDGAGSTLSAPVNVTVIDLPESIGQITLTNQTVPEWEPGADVGGVQVDGGSVGSNWELTVDDSRFELDGSTLKLVDGIWVERASAEQLQIEINATDSTGSFADVSQIFVIEVLGNETPFHNDEDPYDVDANEVVSPLDALAIINYLNLYGPGPVGPGDPGYGYDVNGDGEVTALDALLVINYLNTLQGGGTVGSGEGDTETSSSSEPEAAPAQSSNQTTPTSSSATPEPNAILGSRLSGRTSGLIGPVNDPPAVSKATSPSSSTDVWSPESGSLNGASDFLNSIRDDQTDAGLELAIDELLLLLSSS